MQFEVSSLNNDARIQLGKTIPVDTTPDTYFAMIWHLEARNEADDAPDQEIEADSLAELIPQLDDYLDPDFIRQEFEKRS